MAKIDYISKAGGILIVSKIKELLGNKVDKVSGKGLSTNDYTTTEKDKLAGIASGANKTTVDTALSSSSTNPVQNKVVNTALGNKVDKVSGKGLSTNDYTAADKNAVATIGDKAPLASPALTGVPTAPTPVDSTNSTQIATTAFVKSVVANAVGGITGVAFEVVQSLPTTGNAGTIYLVSNGKSETNNTHDEYIYASGSWEKLGTTEMDLSSYAKTDDFVAVTTDEINAMFT